MQTSGSDNEENCFGLRLAVERRRLGLTQEELAIRLGTTRQSIYLYEKGERFLDVRHLAKLHSSGADTNFIVTGLPTAEAHDLRSDLLEVQDRVTKILNALPEPK